MHVTVWAPLPRSSPHRGVGEVDSRPVRRGPQAVLMSLRLVSWFSCVPASPLMLRNDRRVWALDQDPFVAGGEHCIGELTEVPSQRPGESVCPAQASLCPAQASVLPTPVSAPRLSCRLFPGHVPPCGGGCVDLRFSSVPRVAWLGSMALHSGSASGRFPRCVGPCFMLTSPLRVPSHLGRE